MARKKRKTAAQKKRAAKIKWRMILLAFLLVTAFFAFMYANAHIVHVKNVDAKIKNYQTFMGEIKILFISDLKLSDQQDAQDAIKLIKNLMETEPDLLIFGGDFTQMRFADAFKIQSEEGLAQVNSRLRDARKKFFVELKSVAPQVRKYAVSGDCDKDIPGLLDDCQMGGVKLIDDYVETVNMNGAGYISLVGFGDYAKNGGTGFRFRDLREDEVVIVVTHNPENYPHITSVIDDRGNPIADLILSGHTLGGQINLFGLNLPAGYDGNFESGIYNEAGPNMLVSNGIGTDWLPFRLGSRPEAVLITLMKK